MFFDSQICFPMIHYLKYDNFGGSMKIAIVTDTNCGLTKKEGEEKGLFIVPMPFNINGEDYLDSVNLSRAEFFEKQNRGEDISTSQPSPEYIMNLWNKILEEYDYIIHIPMSSSLSSSCDTAIMLSHEEEYEGKVTVVDNKRISATQLQAALDAKAMVDLGKTPEEIVKYLMDTRLDATIYLSVDTLKYLKKGGRITAAAAALGTLLRIKPVLYLHEGKIEPFAKARTPKQAKEIMIEAVKKDLEERFGDTDGSKTRIFVVHAECLEQASLLRKELAEVFTGTGEIGLYNLSLSVATHVGPGTMAIAAVKK